MKIGYARVSTIDQNLELQNDALEKAGCELIFEEKISGKTKDRPELGRLISQLRPGDIVVVWKLDRLGRSLKDLIDLVSNFKNKGVEFISLQDSINTATPTGRFTFNIFASLAEFEREIITERTKAGLAAARARGRKGGRPKGNHKVTIQTAKAIKTLYDKGEHSMDEIAIQFKKSRATCYRLLELLKVEEANNER